MCMMQHSIAVGAGFHFAWISDARVCVIREMQAKRFVAVSPFVLSHFSWLMSVLLVFPSTFPTTKAAAMVAASFYTRLRKAFFLFNRVFTKSFPDMFSMVCM